jgi:hypothetical protein
MRFRLCRAPLLLLDGERRLILREATALLLVELPATAGP